MNVSFKSADLQTLISQPQKFSQDSTASTKPAETTPSTEEKPKKHGSTGKGFFWGAVVTLAAAIMIAGKGNPGKGFKAISGEFTKLADEAGEKLKAHADEVEKLKFKANALKDKLVSVIKKTIKLPEKIEENLTKPEVYIDKVAWAKTLDDFPRT